MRIDSGRRRQGGVERRGISALISPPRCVARHVPQISLWLCVCVCVCVCVRGSENFHDTTARPRAVNYVFFVQLRSPTHKLLRGRHHFHLQESLLRAVAFIELVEIDHCVLALFPCVMGRARTTVRAEQVAHRLHCKSTSATSWRRRFRTNWFPRRGLCT